MQFSGGYTSVDTSRSVDQLVTAGSRQDLFLVGFTADSVFLDASAPSTHCDVRTRAVRESAGRSDSGNRLGREKR
jgi:hypothetical protein